MDRWVLSVNAPDAYLIIYGIKDVENRSWEIKNLPRTIEIHTIQKTAQPWIHSDLDLPSGYIDTYRSARDSGNLGAYANFHNLVLAEKSYYGVNDFKDVDPEKIKMSNWRDWFLKEQAIIGKVDVIACIKNSQSPFADKNQYHWVLTNPVLYDIPIMPVMGKQRLWRYLNV